MKAVNANEFLQRYWTFFLGFEQDLLKTERYVSFDTDNYDTFSVEYNRLYQAVCSEVDVLAKQLCNLLGEKNPDNINQYYQPIITAYPCIKTETVTIQGLGPFKPWESWTANKAPEWWQLYNKVKHRRTEICQKNGSCWKDKPFYKCASLQNVLTAMTGLYVLEFYTLLLICHRDYDPASNHGNSEYNKLHPLLIDKIFHLPRWVGCCSFFMGNTFVDERRVERLLVEHTICFPDRDPQINYE